MTSLQLHVTLFAFDTDYTLRKVHDGKLQCIIAVTGGAHCQRQRLSHRAVFFLLETII